MVRLNFRVVGWLPPHMVSQGTAIHDSLYGDGEVSFLGFWSAKNVLPFKFH